MPNPSDPQADVRAEYVAERIAKDIASDTVGPLSSEYNFERAVPHIERGLRAYASRRVREELTEAAKAMCSWCDLGQFDGRSNDVRQIGSDGADWYHIVRPALDDSGRDTFRCEAGPIHGLLARLRDKEPQ